MDALNAGLWTLLTTDAQLVAACPGGAWNPNADEGTPLPLLRIEKVIGQPRYVFRGMGSLRYVYRITVYAEDTSTKTAARLAEEIKGEVQRVTNSDSLTVAGYKVLNCEWTDELPPSHQTASGTAPETYSEAILIEIILAPA